MWVVEGCEEGPGPLRGSAQGSEEGVRWSPQDLQLSLELFTLCERSDRGPSSPSSAQAFPLSNGCDPMACEAESGRGRENPVRAGTSHVNLPSVSPLCCKGVGTSVPVLLTTPGATQWECPQRLPGHLEASLSAPRAGCKQVSVCSGEGDLPAVAWPSSPQGFWSLARERPEPASQVFRNGGKTTAQGSVLPLLCKRRE